jgi:hypothetical protein
MGQMGQVKYRKMLTEGDSTLPEVREGHMIKGQWK